MCVECIPVDMLLSLCVRRSSDAFAAADEQRAEMANLCVDVNLALPFISLRAPVDRFESAGASQQ